MTVFRRDRDWHRQEHEYELSRRETVWIVIAVVAVLLLLWVVPIRS